MHELIIMPHRKLEIQFLPVLHVALAGGGGQGKPRNNTDKEGH